MNKVLIPQEQGSFWLPPQASTTAPEVDWIFHLIFAISLFFFILIIGLMILFVIRYRRREGVEAQQTATHNLALELTWSGVPVVLSIVIFFFGFKSFMNMTVTPANAYPINVTAQKWKWVFEYPNGHVAEDLHVPVGRAVELTMSSQDVIHGFYIPAFRVQRDVVPGRYNKTWFQATTPGEYQLYCAQYCGTGHSDMTALVVVHPPGEFDKWLQDASDLFKRLTPVQVGERLYKIRCSSCHTVDGSAKIGPSWKGLFGRTAEFKDGTTTVADENYIRHFILEPNFKIIKGYEPVMPTFKGQVNDKEIGAIIDYIKTLK
jgi:cytochrome c oxidase subunit II